MTAIDLDWSGPIHADLIVNEETREVTLGGEPVTLTRMEFDILATLYQAPRRVFTPAQLLQEVWATDWIGDERSAEVYISRLRKKLGESGKSSRFIRTVRGVGYSYQPSSTVNFHSAVFMFGTDMILRAVVSEHDLVLGWAIDEILGTAWTPTLTGTINRTLLRLVLSSGMAEIFRRSAISGHREVRQSNGEVIDVAFRFWVADMGESREVVVDASWPTNS
jgi:DNA-binding winged helix-turn-helix (wHTH) protein